jgi:uncharacterized membrane protein
VTRPESGLGHDAARRNVDEIANLEQQSAGQQSAGERISTAVTNAVGTGWCAGLHVAGLVTWILWNSRLAPQRWRFDPYPFGLLTMWVSMEGVILAILVLITQNRMSRQSDRRDHLDLQVDLLAEQEMTMVLRILSRIADRIGATGPRDEAAQTEQLMQPTDVRQLMDELSRRFP